MAVRDLHQLSSVIRRERVRRGMSVRDLAKASNLTPSTVSRLEVGLVAEPRASHLQALARGLGIDAEELYASVGYFGPAALPDLQPYLRTKYGLDEDASRQVAGYVQALRDRAESSVRKEDNDDNPGGSAP